MKCENNLFNRIRDIQNQFSQDFGGGSLLSKCYIMAYLASSYKLKNYVEIGVYKGRSLFSVAPAFQDNNGKAYGIDPYVLVEAKEFDLEENFKNTVNTFLEGLDFEEIYKNVIINTEKFNLSNVVEIIRKTSLEATSYFKNIEIDMLHIDGNHDTEHVREDINNYAPLMRECGIIVFDDINWECVKICYDEVKSDYIILLETNDFAILMKKDKNPENLDNAEMMSIKLKNLFRKLVKLENKKEVERTSINVGLLAYNNEKYIVECLNSIVRQKGEFYLNIIICEDKSTDETSNIIEAYIKASSIGKSITFEYLKSEENLGRVKNLKRLLKACSGSEYTALIDGNDYWIDEGKLQMHVELMKSNPECSFSFDQNQEKYEFFDLQHKLNSGIYSATDIIDINNYLTYSISSCFYYTQYLDQISKDFFEMFGREWMLNIICSQFGDIGYIKRPMTVSRKNDKDICLGLQENEKKK
ncbi:class I SAM-dependent methyltransferase [Clostridium lacusfryxellense]|uniref:class I SAM-dependent methyltransferase n=1 Tax=Clostridium lacusfryxellense TaxID=205328 RepID=UPI001C0AEFE9|nr:class I SAM-dependent methyltransferase [Clostridium lacusfryxellense]MBU3112294.1 class I SAM-dependent methyltransferase [Clostridium lacusfryxellense]